MITSDPPPPVLPATVSVCPAHVVVADAGTGTEVTAALTAMIVATRIPSRRMVTPEGRGRRLAGGRNTRLGAVLSAASSRRQRGKTIGE
jgi:hypothetical protein